MKQVRHYLGNEALDIGEVPMPALGAGDILVRNHYSFVSVGTEKMKVSQARMSLVQKAKERPDQVKLVLGTLREQDLVPTLRKVQERLKAPTTLGYSCAGTVVAAGSEVDEFRVDDRWPVSVKAWRRMLSTTPCREISSLAFRAAWALRRRAPARSARSRFNRYARPG